MDRRMIGAVLLTLVAIAAIGVPNIAGHRVNGSPQAAVIPPPPAVGDCVTSLLGQPNVDPEIDSDTPVGYPYAQYGNCDGDIVGEVMSVDPTAHRLDRATISSYQSDSSTCELSEVYYVGSIGPFDPATITTPGIAWQAQVIVQSLAIGPSALQRAAGQSWTACVGATQDGASYRGRIRDALTIGALPSVFATCWASFLSLADQPVSCGKPHSVEILATTQITDPTDTPAEVQRSCLGMASRALRTDDPTKGGKLVVKAYSSGGPSLLPLTSVTLFAGFSSCIASVPKPSVLTGTLIGIGAKPPPISG